VRLRITLIGLTALVTGIIVSLGFMQLVPSNDRAASSHRRGLAIASAPILPPPQSSRPPRSSLIQPNPAGSQSLPTARPFVVSRSLAASKLSRNQRLVSRGRQRATRQPSAPPSSAPSPAPAQPTGAGPSPAGEEAPRGEQPAGSAPVAPSTSESAGTGPGACEAPGTHEVASIGASPSAAVPVPAQAQQVHAVPTVIQSNTSAPSTVAAAGASAEQLSGKPAPGATPKSLKYCGCANESATAAPTSSPGEQATPQTRPPTPRVPASTDSSSSRDAQCAPSQDPKPNAVDQSQSEKTGNQSEQAADRPEQAGNQPEEAMNKSVPHTGEPPEESACRVKEDEGDTSNAATEPGACKAAEFQASRRACADRHECPTMGAPSFP